ncbi:YhgE/Pip domain-containing protein [Limnobacter humi]|uniref:YhgE/Pip domain-containing protein n=1 Tax=Limnobacter humi TaxID=1778671 RepID=A0ABT1WFW7_9BURK|nr:YhgE/Pip domain-containing protein [Limnobacter humi]MCQ8896417.1 YhgE/Pip domain-containing protein [Limnobacter humi]
MGLVRQIQSVVHADWGLLRRYPRLRLSAFGVCFIPALYATIYISSMWDPESKAPQLPVLIVNHDAGTAYKGEAIHVGQSLTDKLQADRKLGFVLQPDEQKARAMVRDGEVDFALIIPENFSAEAVGASRSGAGELVVFTSEGNNYTGANVAKKFAPEVSRRLNELLNERRWTKVSEIAADSEIKVAKLKEGVSALNAGAARLKEGLEKASEGSTQLNAGLGKARDAGVKISAGAGQLRDSGLKITEGMKQLGGGIAQMNAKLPADTDLAALKDGATQVAEGNAQLSQGLGELKAGSVRLTDGLTELKTKTASIPFFGTKVSNGAAQLEEGSIKLGNGLSKAKGGSDTLADGSARVRDGVVKLSDGMGQLAGGIRTMHSKMPAASDLDRYGDGLTTLAGATGQLSQGLNRLEEGSGKLDNGLAQLADGAGQLSNGLNLLDEAVPSKLNIPNINPAGFSSTVQTRVEVAAPVQNNGSAFGSNFIPLSLWVGAVMTSFLFHYRKLPLSLAHHGNWSKCIGKMLIPSFIVAGQVVIMLLTVGLLLGISIAHPVLLTITLFTASIVFVSIVMALVRWLGDTGKVMAVLFLILQLSSSGAIVPIQLSGELFQLLHPYLPFTWVVKATKVALFDAFDGQWLWMYAHMLLTPLVLWPIATYTGRWVHVPDEQYVPALDVT